MTLKELREKRKKANPFFSDCCKTSFTGHSNSLYTYYVCECGKKTMPINGKGKMLDLYGLVKKITK